MDIVSVLPVLFGGGVHIFAGHVGRDACSQAPGPSLELQHLHLVHKL